MPRSREARALEAAAPVFAALGDPTRLRLVARLCDEGPQSIARLTDRADVTRQAVTKHIRVLADAGVVRAVGEGKARVWEIDRKRLDDARHELKAISRRWDEAIERLRAFVED